MQILGLGPAPPVDLSGAGEMLANSKLGGGGERERERETIYLCAFSLCLSLSLSLSLSGWHFIGRRARVVAAVVEVMAQFTTDAEGGRAVSYTHLTLPTS